MKPTDKQIHEAADKYVFVEADHNRKWSNNDDTAGDNFGSFKAGVNWTISQMQPEWVACSERLPEIGLGGVQILLEDSHSKERFQMTANYDGDWIFPRDPAERVKVIYWHYLLPQPPTK